MHLFFFWVWSFGTGNKVHRLVYSPSSSDRERMLDFLQALIFNLMLRFCSPKLMLILNVQIVDLLHYYVQDGDTVSIWIYILSNCQMLCCLDTWCHHNCCLCMEYLWACFNRMWDMNYDVLCLVTWITGSPRTHPLFLVMHYVVFFLILVFWWGCTCAFSCWSQGCH